MQEAEGTISELSDSIEQLASGIGDVDLLSFKAALDARFTQLQDVLLKRVSLLRILKIQALLQ